ncbi:MAG: PPOX class F420-dependent oxidoreductase [Propionibacteriales bacterium]|nr:PPOX class F420-dependent oxidoreductase [Propionibacteriales bacterium]
MSAMNAGPMRSRRYVTGATSVAGTAMASGGVWALAAPGSFAEFVDFPGHVHFLHDLGAFQIGAAVTLFLALIWSDALTTALAGFLVGNTIHVINHVADLDLGGYAGQIWALAALSLAVAAALVLRLRGLGYVVGEVDVATTPVLAPYVRQKTVLLTTYRRDGRAGGTPVSIAVDGDHAFVRSFERSLKTRRLARNPEATITPSTGRGEPTGSAVRVRMRRLEGADDRYAARMLARKHPFLHGVLVPLTHRIARAKAGRTVHFVVTPLDPVAEPGEAHDTASATGRQT